MKFLSILFTILMICCLSTYGQKVISGKSKPIKIGSATSKTTTVPKTPTTPGTKSQKATSKPKVVIDDAIFSDANNNKRIDAYEKCGIAFTIENKGKAAAYNIEVKLFEKNNIMGLVFEPSQKLGNLPSGKVLTVTIPVEGTKYLQSGVAKFEISVKTSQGIDVVPVQLTVNTKEFDEMNYLSQQNQLRGGGDPLKGLNISKATKEIQIGNYFSLIIGIDNYKGNWMPLNNAVRDAKAVENILKTNYKFNNFRTLYNEFATRENIIKELEWLVKNVKENDNVFIYYSGHGEFKKDLKKGYWIPVDAEIGSTYDYVSNSDIQTFLAAIKSKHTLLISDACFSGDIFRGKTISVPFEDTEKYYKKVHDLKSRQAITSGGIEPVMDGGSEGHSVFTYYLLKALKNSEAKYYDAGQLYNDIKIPVTNNSDQSPILQPIKNTGDEGGQFLFIKK